MKEYLPTEPETLMLRSLFSEITEAKSTAYDALLANNNAQSNLQNIQQRFNTALRTIADQNGLKGCNITTPKDFSKILETT